MKKTIFKSFIHDFIKNFALYIFSLSIIIWIIQAVNYLDFVAEDGHGFRVYFYYTLLSIPKIISRILMFVFFVSLFHTIIKIDDRNELLIYWINGIRKIDFKRLIIGISIICLFIQLVLNIYVTPKTQDLARSYIRSSSIDFLPSLIKEKKFIDTVQDLTIFIENKKENGKLENIFLKTNINNKDYQIIYAREGEIKFKNNQNYLLLENGEIIDSLNNKQKTISFNQTEFNLSRYGTKTTTSQKIQEVETKNILECINNKKNLKRLNNDIFQCKEEVFPQLYQELIKRLIHPLYIPLLAVICCLTILRNKDSYNYYIYKFLLFFLGFIFIILGEILLRYTGSNMISNLQFIMIPLLSFLILNLFFNFKSKVN
mgnify:CR=1 FL=1